MEFALIAMPLILLMFMIVEAAFLMKDYVSVSSAVRSGARTASASAGAGQGTCDPGSDEICNPATAPKLAQAAAQAIQTNATALNPEDVEYVIVYKADPSDGYPIGQDSLVCSSSCVKYKWDVGLEKFRYNSGSWASAKINACTNDPLRDSVGVGMKINHSMVSGFFGTTLSLEEHTVMQFEPLLASECKPDTHQ